MQSINNNKNSSKVNSLIYISLNTLRDYLYKSLKSFKETNIELKYFRLIVALFTNSSFLLALYTK